MLGQDPTALLSFCLQFVAMGLFCVTFFNTLCLPEGGELQNIPHERWRLHLGV
jgi:hypothetical protein